MVQLYSRVSRSLALPISTMPRFIIPLADKLNSSVCMMPATFARNSRATYIDSNGVIQTAAINEPRFQDGGLLIEPTATNLFINSSAPVTQNITVVSGTSYTVWGTGAGSVVLSDAGSGTVTAAAPITFTASTNTLTCTVTNMSTVQVERGTAPTSYIPTSGAATTRTADVLRYNVSDVITQGQGSLYCEFILNGIKGDFYTFLHLSDGTTSNRIFNMYSKSLGGIQTVAFTDGSVVTSLLSGVNSSEIGTVYKTMLTYTDDNVRLYVNGVLTAIDSICIMPNISPAYLSVCTTYDGTQVANGIVKNVKYFSEALSEAEAIKLTTI